MNQGLPHLVGSQNILKCCFIFFKENYKYLEIPVGKGFPKRRYLVIPREIQMISLEENAYLLVTMKDLRQE